MGQDRKTVTAASCQLRSLFPAGALSVSTEHTVHKRILSYQKLTGRLGCLHHPVWGPLEGSPA